MKTLFNLLLGACLTLGVLTPSRLSADVDFEVELTWRANETPAYNAAAILYEYDNYRGRQIILYPGESLNDVSAYYWDFRVRSVQIIGPVSVFLYDESDFWGHQITVSSNITDLSEVRMRLSPYTVFDWGRRARSAYVTYRSPEIRVSIDLVGIVLPRLYCGSPIRPRYYTPPPNFSPVLPRPHPGYRPSYPPPHYRPAPPPPGRPPAVHPPGGTPPVPRPPSARPPMPPPTTRPGGVPPPPPRSGVVPPSRPPQIHPPAPPAAAPGGRPSGTPPPRNPPTSTPSPSQRPAPNPPPPPPASHGPGEATPSTPPPSPPTQAAPPQSHPQPPPPPSYTPPSRSNATPPAPPPQPRQPPPGRAPSRNPPPSPRPR